MAGLSARRLAAVGSVVVVALWAVGSFLSGRPPAFAASSPAVAGYFHAHHDKVLIASVLVAIGIAVYLGVLAQLRVELRGTGQRTFASILGLGASASAAVFAVGDALQGTLGQAASVPGRDPGVLRALYQLDQFTAVPEYWLVLVIVIPLTLAGALGAFPRWTAWASGALGVLIALGGISVKASGLFAAGTGLLAHIAFLAVLAFLLEAGVLLWTMADADG
jgi:hypothetical protein